MVNIWLLFGKTHITCCSHVWQGSGSPHLNRFSNAISCFVSSLIHVGGLLKFWKYIHNFSSSASSFNRTQVCIQMAHLFIQKILFGSVCVLNQYSVILTTACVELNPFQFSCVNKISLIHYLLSNNCNKLCIYLVLIYFQYKIFLSGN